MPHNQRVKRWAGIAAGLVTLISCSHNPPPNAPVGVGASTQNGLHLISPKCEQVDGSVIATGTVRVEGSAQSDVFTITLRALRLHSDPGLRTATYPSPQQTGEMDVPFRISAESGQDFAGTCDLTVVWGRPQ